MTQNVTIKAFNWLSISKTFGFTLICQVINNTIIDSQRWRARILQLVKLQTFITNGSKENDIKYSNLIFEGKILNSIEYVQCAWISWSKKVNLDTY